MNKKIVKNYEVYMTLGENCDIINHIIIMLGKITDKMQKRNIAEQRVSRIWQRVKKQETKEQEMKSRLPV